MEKDTKPKAKPKPRKPQRVEMVNTDKRNGLLGAVARPFEGDTPKWEARGWKRAKSAGNAE